MITVCTLLWDANGYSKSFSSMYNETWVEKLYRGFARHLNQPFRFICYTDRKRTFSEPILQRQLESKRPSYADCIQPYELNCPMILVGLDTVVTGNVDHLAAYCLTANKIALPTAPYKPQTVCNGVALVPEGFASVYLEWSGENDMDWMRRQPHERIGDMFPGHVASYKGDVADHGLGDARIVYFHGEQKPHQLRNEAFIQQHWR